MNEGLLLSVILMSLLLIKHYLFDFVFQGPYQHLNKGTYGHPGGLLHTGLHLLGTALVLLGFQVIGWWGLPTFSGPLDAQFNLYVLSAPWKFIGLILLVEGLIHYHADWLKVNINRINDWHSSKDPEFWWLMGLDQLTHQMTYIVITFWYLSHLKYWI